mgnify:CR=1 FL=1
MSFLNLHQPESATVHLCEKLPSAACHLKYHIFCFPYAAYDHIDYSKVKAVLDVEMSIPAQFVDDVAVAVKDRCLIETCLCSGGNIMSRDKVLAAVKKIMEGK